MSSQTALGTVLLVDGDGLGWGKVTTAGALELPNHGEHSTRVGLGWEWAPSPVRSLNPGTQHG